ncbi:MAG: endonuclease/exonuclease/phosphatase family protein [Shinella sp.]|nr:endonuclease/exonuclease/phosphatase family protein [Shinella sp.]
MKITTWNIEHFSSVISSGGSGAVRLPHIVREIREIDPDVLCISECTPDLAALREFCRGALGGDYVVPVIEGTDEALAAQPDDPRKALAKLYKMQGNGTTGAQWIWFLVKSRLAEGAHLLDPRIFDAFARERFMDADDRERDDGKWAVYEWGKTVKHFHGHWRHPQTLILPDIDGKRVEIIGAHLKSKLNTYAQRNDPFVDEAAGELRPEFVDEAVNDRIQLTTEAVHIRNYIDAMFEKEPEPAIIVLGDLNDGPGKELLERRFLFFDLISNIQGDVFFARRFLNHALFDFSEELRWSYFLDGDDPIDPERDPRILLDHILFTQRLVDDGQFPRFDAGSGLVEHAIHDRINATLPKRQRTSDHKPVSAVLTRRANV